MMTRHLVMNGAVLAALLQACGGSDRAPSYEDLRAAADREQAKAIALAQPTPCVFDSQCAALKFLDAFPSCNQGTYQAYSIDSPTAAAAVQAAQNQRQLALEALHLAPQRDVVCTTQVQAPPLNVCIQGACSLRTP